MTSGPVAIVERAPTPYRRAVFNEIGKRRDVTVYYYLSDGSGDRWSPDSASGEGSFDEKILPSIRVGPFLLVPTLPCHLLRGEFEEVVGTSDTNLVPTMLLILPFIIIKNSIFTIWTEEIDTNYRYNRYQQQSLLKHFLALAFWKSTGMGQRILYQTSDRIIAYSELARDAALNKDASNSKIITRPQAIDPSILSTPSSNFEPPQGEPTILFLGTVERRKGVDVLVNSIDDFPDSAKVWIAGEGPLRDPIETVTTSDNRVEIFGRVSESTKTKLLQQTDVLVLPSRHEPWGIVVLEALACGTPAITTSSAGAAMILDESSIVDPENPQQLAEAVLSVIGTEPPNPPDVHEMAEPLYYTESLK
ncbi:glycosyltransferase family 4 protein [Natrinema sp. H-ect1]|uniref:glycosyltransferase family 4 protein n=1 Tax=Natrinema sp. H-ect1 TaxID=3242700 RepID=UPI00359D6708